MITLDGIKLSEYGLFVQFGHQNPLTPNIENLSLAIPGRDGLYSFGTEIREKSFSIPMILIEANKAEQQHKLRMFVSDCFDIYGKPKLMKMIFDYEPDKYYMVKCDKQIIPERILSTGSIELSLIAYYPYALSTVYSDEILWGSEAITFMSGYLLGHTGSDGLKTISAPTTLNIHVDGLVVKPVIEITGSATSLILSVNGYTITLTAFTSASLVIDCDKYTVLKNGINAFGLVSLREFILLPGGNSVSVTGTGINVSIQIKSRDKYI